MPWNTPLDPPELRPSLPSGEPHLNPTSRHSFSGLQPFLPAPSTPALTSRYILVTNLYNRGRKGQVLRR